MKPIIGLSVQYSEDCTAVEMKTRYSLSVERAGGIPLIIPEIAAKSDLEQLCRLCDGIIFTGGEDVDPSVYHAEKSAECGRTSPHRDEYELKLFESVFAMKKPVLGICRGIQLLNSALGGTLYQHIPNHRGTTHKIAVYRGSVLCECVGSEVCTVNSFHHQAIKKPADGLKVLARAADGTVESVTLPEYPFLLGVQWHPEVTLVNGNDAVSLRIFERYINECRRLRTQT